MQWNEDNRLSVIKAINLYGDVVDDEDDNEADLLIEKLQAMEDHRPLCPDVDAASHTRKDATGRLPTMYFKSTKEGQTIFNNMKKKLQKYYEQPSQIPEIFRGNPDEMCLQMCQKYASGERSTTTSAILGPYVDASIPDDDLPGFIQEVQRKMNYETGHQHTTATRASGSQSSSGITLRPRSQSLSNEERVYHEAKRQYHLEKAKSHEHDEQNRGHKPGDSKRPRLSPQGEGDQSRFSRLGKHTRVASCAGDIRVYVPKRYTSSHIKDVLYNSELRNIHIDDGSTPADTTPVVKNRTTATGKTLHPSRHEWTNQEGWNQSEEVRDVFGDIRADSIATAYKDYGHPIDHDTSYDVTIPEYQNRYQ